MSKKAVRDPELVTAPEGAVPVEPPNLLLTGPNTRDDQQQCVSCGQWLTRSGHFFDADRQSSTGYRKECKQCRAENRKAKRNELIAQRVSKIDESAAKFLERLTDPSVASVPELSDIAQSLVHAFGGAEGLAQHYLGNFLAAAPGSTTRQKALDRIIGMMEKISLSGRGSMDGMSDDEVREELAKRIERTGLKVLRDDSA